MPATLEVVDLPHGVRQLTLHHPERRNALDDALLDALEAAVTRAEGVRCFLVRGGGERLFSAGYDLTALTGFPEGTPLPDERLAAVFDALTHHPAPSVALVTGPAIGAGCELALACDFRVGDAHARFVMPPARIGVVYALQGLRRVVRRVGEGRARYLFLTGRAVEGEAAHRFGLLDVLAPDAEGEARRLCEELARQAPLALAGLKQGFALLEGGATPEALAAFEARRRESFNSADAREGRDAALQKRAPVFRGA